MVKDEAIKLVERELEGREEVEPARKWSTGVEWRGRDCLTPIALEIYDWETLGTTFERRGVTLAVSYDCKTYLVRRVSEEKPKALEKKVREVVAEFLLEVQSQRSKKQELLNKGEQLKGMFGQFLTETKVKGGWICGKRGECEVIITQKNKTFDLDLRGLSAITITKILEQI